MHIPSIRKNHGSPGPIPIWNVFWERPDMGTLHSHRCVEPLYGSFVPDLCHDRVLLASGKEVNCQEQQVAVVKWLHQKG